MTLATATASAVAAAPAVGLPLPLVGAFLCAFARAAAWLLAMPLAGDSAVPPRLRVAVAALLALAVAPARPPIGLDALPLAVPGELLVGLAVGFTARALLAGVEAGGQLLGLFLELGFAGHFDPLLKEEALPTRRIAYVLGGLAFLGADGLELTARALIHAPVDGHTLARATATLIAAGGDVLVLAVRAAAPLVIAALVANVAVALASRAAPALNVFSVMLAVVATVGALVLSLTAPAWVREIGLGVRHALDGVARTVTP